MKRFLEEFKSFAIRGNVVDLAIGVIIGAAFGKIVTSLVDDILMPVLGVLTGGINMNDLAWTLRSATDDTPAVLFAYGAFLSTIINFLIIAFAIFVAVRYMNRLLKAEEKNAPASPPKPTRDQELLTEIRDLLRR